MNWCYSRNWCLYNFTIYERQYIQYYLTVILLLLTVTQRRRYFTGQIQRQNHIITVSVHKIFRRINLNFDVFMNIYARESLFD